MDEILEVVVEIVMDGLLELAENKKMPFLVRIIAILFSIAVYIGIIGLIAAVGLKGLRQGNLVGAIFCFAVDVFLLLGAILLIRKKMLMKK